MIELNETDGIALLRMVNGKANAMSLEFCDLLTVRLDELSRSSVRAVVMTGTGRIFSAGVDLLRLLDGGADYVSRFLPALHRMLTTAFSSPKPLVAAINGHAIAGGCVLACAADKRLMARDAGRIGVPELLVGVPFPSSALEIMRNALAPQHFAEAILSGATYSVAEAAERRMIEAVVPSEALLDRAMECAKGLAALPPAAFASAKQQMRAPALERIQTDASGPEVSKIWESHETLDRVREYVSRTLRNK
jgi:enoyl-CoA hydratase